MSVDTGANQPSGIDAVAATIKNPFSTTVGNFGERGPDFPGGFQIIEYVNGQPKLDTIFRFVGNAMPFQPFEWSGEQRLVKDYYPGNPEAVVHVMGAKEGPLPVKGRWKDKRFKDPSYYGVAYQYNLAINEIRKRGNLLKFGMHGMAGDWFRFGFLERGNFKMNKLGWIDYELDFFVVSERQPINNYFAAREKNSPNAINQQLINAAQNFQQNYSAVPTSMPRSISEMMNNITSGIAKNINLVTNFVDTVINTAQSIEDSANRALGLIKNIRAQLSKWTRQIDTIQQNFNNLSHAGDPATIVRDTYKNMKYLHETMAGTHTLSQFLAMMQAQFEALARSVPKARYKVQAKDTLQNISIKFYQSADNWTKIADHNHLQTTVLVPGQILEIPNL